MNPETYLYFVILGKLRGQQVWGCEICGLVVFDRDVHRRSCHMEAK